MHNATRTPKTNASVLNYAATHDRMCKHTRAQEYQPIVAENEHHLFVIVALRRPASPHSCGVFRDKAILTTLDNALSRF